MTSNFTLLVHKISNGYICEIDIANQSSTSTESPTMEPIVILDRSESMGDYFPIVLKKIIPSVFLSLGYKETDMVNLITFDSLVYTERLSIKKLKTSTLKAKGLTEMKGVFDRMETIMHNCGKNEFVILALSDGEIWDQSETLANAYKFKERNKGKYSINAQAIRFFTDENPPDTTALTSILQLNTDGNPNILDVNASMDKIDEISAEICSIFKGNLGINLKIISQCASLKKDPWSESLKAIRLIGGKNIFWADSVEELKMLINGEEESAIQIKNSDNITLNNYEELLKQKLDYYFKKVKILKVLNTNESLIEIDETIKHLKDFESSLTSNEDIQQIKNSHKIASRVMLIKNIAKKKRYSIARKMEEVRNIDKIEQLNSQQKSDFLREIELSDKTGKSLAKRAFSKGLDFDQEARNEVKEMAAHIDEIKDIDDSLHKISFYSASTTLEGIKELCELTKDNSFEEISVNDIIKVINIVGIGCEGNTGNFPDPLIYRFKKVYPGCYISFSDIFEAFTVSKGNDLKVPGGNNDIITNAIPVFDDERIYYFLLKYAPKILEYTASIGMRRVIADVPCTYEALTLAGLYRLTPLLNKTKSEVNINTFKGLVATAKGACGKHYYGVISEINRQKDADDTNAIYLKEMNFYQMITPLIPILNDTRRFPNKLIQRVLRSIIQEEVYHQVVIIIKKRNDEKEYRREILDKILGIDYKNKGTKLPQLFEKSIKPIHSNQYEFKEEEFNLLFKFVKNVEMIALMSKFLAVKESSNYYNEIKSIPELNDELLKEILGITYDIKYFWLFNVVQSLCNRERKTRVDEEAKKMKINDFSKFDIGNKLCKEYAKRAYTAHYELEKKNQIKKEFDIISNELVWKLILSKDINEYIALFRNGITKGYLNFKIENPDSKGFNELKEQLANLNKQVPCRVEKIKVILLGVDDKEEIVWNRGNVYNEGIDNLLNAVGSVNVKLKKDLIQKMSQKIHVYREKPNRQGHSNDKPSYWALGYKTLDEMFEAIDKQAKEEYMKKHIGCCGLKRKILNVKEGCKKKII